MKVPLEQKVRQQAQRDAIQKRLTLLLARLTVRQGRSLFVSDDILVKQLGLMGRGRDPAFKVRQALQRLECKGLVTRNGRRAAWSARLTPAGARFAQVLELSGSLVANPKRWDGRWRMVIFDVWERRRPVRDKLRRGLQNAGFYKIQNSVWAYPYDCEDLLVFLRAELRLGSGVLYVIADGIEGDARLRRHFGLKY
ncbi:MAG TPA: hypothetical protein VGP13_04500 [Candidatus Paceibacterota bacterium]|jgi:DNA-binding transcriptional regulator PaaX|nr:hypothetical protein [Candidatus Paceibacterota bacterium]